MNAADSLSRLLRRVNFAVRLHPAGMQETEAYRAGEGVKVSRIQKEYMYVLYRRIPDNLEKKFNYC